MMEKGIVTEEKFLQILREKSFWAYYLDNICDSPEKLTIYLKEIYHSLRASGKVTMPITDAVSTTCSVMIGAIISNGSYQTYEDVNKILKK